MNSIEKLNVNLQKTASILSNKTILIR